MSIGRNQLAVLTVVLVLAIGLSTSDAATKPPARHHHNRYEQQSSTTTTTTTSVDPASLKLWLGESALQSVIAYVEPILLNSLKNISIPDQKISALGITIYLTDMLLVGFNFSEIAVSFDEPSDVSLVMNNLQALATMNWEYTDGPGIDLHGTAVDTISNTAMGIDLTMSDNGGGGQLTINTALSANVGSLDIALSGPGSQFFQVIVNMIHPILVSVFQNVITSTIGGKVNQLISELLAAIPTKIPIDPTTLPGVYLNYGLIPTADVHGLVGTYYPGDNSFGGGGSYGITYQHFDQISIDNYQSYDVSGWVSPVSTGTYTYQISYDQRGQLDINGQSIGGLEMHNPGMCWPEHSSHTTGAMSLVAGTWYPIRLRYQSGCGGGWLSLYQCDAQGQNCVAIEPLSLYSVNNNNNPEIPVTVTSTAVVMNVAAGVSDVNATQSSPYHPQSLPAEFVITNNTQMLRIELEAYIFQSLLWSLDQTLPNGLWLSISPITVPPSQDWMLNTSTWRTILPGLYNAFPDQLFSVFVGPTVTPIITIDPIGGVTLTVDTTFNISMSPYPIHWGSETVIQIDVKQSVGIDLTIRDGTPNVLTGSVTDFTTDSLTLVYADVPVFNVTELLPLLNLLSHDVIEPAINKILAKGFPIPVLGPLALHDPIIVYDSGVLAIATDFEFGKTVELLGLFSLKEEENE